ncbi:hypothetical protein REC12_06695 [Desulfosporosinus sp. PR]|nr:hypothetical protein [Desulfosporosinus sp. PR]
MPRKQLWGLNQRMSFKNGKCGPMPEDLEEQVVVTSVMERCRI